MKSYTSLEQSKNLAKFLPIESADMFYLCGCEMDAYFGEGCYEELKNWTTNGMSRPKDVPCWSLTALLNILPYPQLSKDKLSSEKVWWAVSTYPNNFRYDSSWHDNQVDACYEMILKLHEQNIL